MTTKTTKLEKAEKAYNSHFGTNCLLCRDAVFNVNSQGCPIARDLSREVREAAKKRR